MKDSAVAPAGLFDLRRQAQLLNGLADRYRRCTEKQQQLAQQHREQIASEATELESRLTARKLQCGHQRREMLQRWDAAEEAVTNQYESNTIALRRNINRLAATFRRREAEQTKQISHEAETKRLAIMAQFDSRKDEPPRSKRKQAQRISEALRPIEEARDRARKLTVARLDHVPEVAAPDHPWQTYGETVPHSVDEVVDVIGRLTQRCEQATTELQSSLLPKLVDRYFLPAATGIALFLLGITALFFGWDLLKLAIALGLLIVVGFVAYLMLLIPLKKLTRRWHPEVERITQVAEHAARIGHRLATDAADSASRELKRERDTQLAAVKMWHSAELKQMREGLQSEQASLRRELVENLETVAQDYGSNYERVGTQMRNSAEQVANTIQQELVETETSVKESRVVSAQLRSQEIAQLAERLNHGVASGIARIATTQEHLHKRFPAWLDVLSGSFDHSDKVDFLPVGSVQVRESLATTLHLDEATVNAPASPVALPESIPLALHRRLHGGLLITAPPDQLQSGIELAHQVLWRLLSAAPPARAKLTLIDPLGRGQNFTGFMALADHDPAIVGHRVWTTEEKIEARLAELAHHVEDVLQASLRDRFQRIEDYNELAGSMAEPYRAVAAVGLPEGLSRRAYNHLQALIESGLRCGLFTVLVCDRSKPWPADMSLTTTQKLLRLELDDAGNWRCDAEGLRDLPFEPYPPPPPDVRVQLVEKIGKAAVAAAKVEIPLENLLASEREAEGSTADGIEIAIGSQGANRSLSLELGEGVRQHVLIAGKTGSGKSTLLHSIITSGAYHYQPDELELYLLDFKKGVEFKPYAESKLPHARVIGIESEREFGRSVLQRLDNELQRRGELFRGVAAQELAAYRQAGGKAMPRILLVIDEFQELFVRDDRLASDCAMLLDRLVRQGRSFGIHVVLSSQSLAGAYSLPRATLGQMAVRVALQCSESDAALILSDDNTAARLINRPGEAIYNDAGGLVEGNQPFQVAWLSATWHRKLLRKIAERDEAFAAALDPPVIFEGNRPCRWTPALANAALAGTANPATLPGLLGESVEIGPPVTVSLSRDSGRNVLMIAPVESRQAIIASIASSMAKAASKLDVICFDGARVDDGEPIAPWLDAAGLKVETIKPRDSDARMIKLAEIVQQRTESGEPGVPTLVVIDPLERFRDLRQDESFSFSLDSAGSLSGSQALQSVLRDGPGSQIFCLVVCGSVETLSRWLPRASQHDLELRVLGRLNASDSSMLIDSPIAAELSAATMLLYDDADGRITKFRQCDLPDAGAVSAWLGCGRND